jgi:hypothetical protein
MRIDADPDPDPCQTLKSQKFKYYMKNILKVGTGNTSKNLRTQA